MLARTCINTWSVPILSLLLILTCLGCGTNDVTAPQISYSSDQVLAAPTNNLLATPKIPLEIPSDSSDSSFDNTTPALNWHELAETFDVWPWDLQLEIPLNVTIPLDDIEVDLAGSMDTSGMGGPDNVEYSIEGSFEFPNDLEIESDDLNIAMVAGTGDIPYLLELTLAVGDIDCASQGDLDITVSGIGLLTGIEGTLHNVVVTLYLAPPYPDHNHFSVYGDPELSFTPEVDFDITLAMHEELVAGLAWLMPPFNLIPPPFNAVAADDFVSAIESDLETEVEDYVEDELEDYIEPMLVSVIESNAFVDDAVDAIDAYFWLLAALETDTVGSIADADTIVICSVNYFTTKQHATYYLMSGN